MGQQYYSGYNEFEYDGYLYPFEPPKQQTYQSARAQYRDGDIMDDVDYVVEETTARVNAGFRQAMGNPLVREAIFFATVFALKLALYIVIKKGAERGINGAL